MSNNTNVNYESKFWYSHPFITSFVISLFFTVIFITPVHHISSDAIKIPYKTQYVQDSSIELGDSQNRQIGVEGEGLKRNEDTKPLFANIIGLDIKYSTKKLPLQTTQAPINKIIAQGTKKYQYMWCSNGSYRYYSNDQFSIPLVGFTHKSPDECAKSGNGHMTSLAESAPQQQSTRTIYQPSYMPTYSPSYTTCHEYSFIDEFSCTTY